MTPRCEFEYCKPKGLLAERLEVMKDRRFDVIPMLQGKDLESGHISDYLDQETMARKMEQGFRYCGDASTKIGEDDRLKEDLHVEGIIARFLSRADKLKVPFFVVDSANKIIGLITLADLDKIAVKMYLFALISELELSLLDIVSKRYGELKNVCCCKYCLRRREKRKKERSKDNLEEYYYLYIKELMHIVTHSDIRNQIEKSTEKILRMKDCEDISQLRNTIAHPKPLVSGKFPINRLIKIHNLIKNLVAACKT